MAMDPRLGSGEPETAVEIAAAVSSGAVSPVEIV
jgi:hypothetical protein